MFSEEERRDIENTLSPYPVKRAGVIEVLRVVQRHRRWISDESVAEVAGLLEMTPAEVDAVATFYSLIFRKPVGRHVILICDSVSCWIMGYDPLREHLTKRLGIQLGETTADGRFTLLPVACLGACDQAPAMMIDGELYGNLDAQKADQALQAHP